MEIHKHYCNICNSPFHGLVVFIILQITGMIVYYNNKEYQFSSVLNFENQNSTISQDSRNITRHKQTSDLNNTKVSDMADDNSSFRMCPLIPPHLKGRLKINSTAPAEKAIEASNPLVKKGGTYRPTSCRARYKVAIIIPYRIRQTHLPVLLNNLHPFLQRQQLQYGIFVIEPAKHLEFNRALLLNVGFTEAIKRYDYDCFVFHDVDMVPENDNNIYSCTKNPRHMSVAIDKFNYKVPVKDMFGGVSAMTKEQFDRVNGFSNKYFGWGGEDNDMCKRIALNGMFIIRYAPNIASYRMFGHPPDKPNSKRSGRCVVNSQWVFAVATWGWVIGERRLTLYQNDA